MPKETIYSETPATDDDAFPPFALAVGWLKDCDVQVGITMTGDRHLVNAILSSGTPDETIDNMVHLGRSAVIAMRQEASVQGLRSSKDEWALDFVTKDAEDRFMFDVGCAINEHLQARYPEWNSIWWNPTRHQINRLIKLLRSARDSAFGRDE